MAKPLTEIALAFLSELPFESFEEFDEGLRAYLPRDNKTENVESELANIAAQLSFSYERRLIPAQNWNELWEANFSPIRVGDLCGVRAHFHPRMDGVQYEIVINPRMAFGTGHHGTTAGCLAAIDRVAKTRRIRRALDVGTGSAVLAIAIAMRLKTPVLASDIDPLAIRIAAGNARLNGAAPWLRTVCAAGVDRREFAVPGGFDLVVANILAGPLVALAPALRRRLAPAGTLILSGLLEHQRNRVAAAYRAQALRLVRSDIREGWVTLTLARARSA